MAYRKNYRRSKFRGRRRGRRGGVMNMRVGDVAQKAYQGVKFLKTLINTEKKFLDTTSSLAVTSAGSVQWLSAITTGTGYNQRTGAVVKGYSLSCRGDVLLNTSAVASIVRIIVFVNKALNHGATPTVLDILQIPSVYSPYNLDNLGDFTVLMDKRITVDNASRKLVDFGMQRKLNHHIRWDASGDLATDTESGHIYMLLVSNEASLGPTVAWYYRLRFIDN